MKRDGVHFSYDNQPDNVGAWRLGDACSKASKDSAGDYIDRGLNLLHRLNEMGYGVYLIAEAEKVS